MPYPPRRRRSWSPPPDADDSMTEHVVADRLDRPVLLVRHTADEIAAAVDEAYPPTEAQVETPPARRARLQMAQMLTRSGLVDDEQLRRAMLEYARTGDPVGDILVAHGAISEDVLVAALSERYQLQRVAWPIRARLRARPPAPRAAGPPCQVIRSPRRRRRMLLAVARPLADERRRRRRARPRPAVPPAAGQPQRPRPARAAGARPPLRRGRHRPAARDTAPTSRPTSSVTAPEGGPAAARSWSRRLRRALARGHRDRPRRRVQLRSTSASRPTGCGSTVRALGTRLETDVTDEEVAALDERDAARLHDPRAAVPRGRGRRRGWCATRRARLPADPARREAAAARRTTTRRSPRSARSTCRRTSTSSSCPTRSRRPSRRPATTACCRPPASTSSSTTPRTGPTPTS